MLDEIFLNYNQVAFLFSGELISSCGDFRKKADAIR